MKKIIVGLFLILGVSMVVQAAPVSITGVAYREAASQAYWFIGEERGGRMITTANIPPISGAEKLLPFEGKKVKITGELLQDRTFPTFDKGFTVEEVQ